MLKHRLLIAILVIGNALTVVAQAPRGFLPADLSAIKNVGDAQVSPDGTTIVYSISETTSDRSGVISRLWIIPTAGGEPKRLMPGNANESTPRWSPDGKWIAFYSNRDGRDGLWVVPAAGGEPKLATRLVRTNFYLTHAGESFTWAPDSKRLAFLSSPEVLADAPPPPPPPLPPPPTQRARERTGSASPSSSTGAARPPSAPGADTTRSPSASSRRCSTWASRPSAS